MKYKVIEKIKSLIDSGYTNQKIALVCGVTPTTVSSWRNTGNIQKKEHLIRLMQIPKIKIIEDEFKKEGSKIEEILDRLNSIEKDMQDCKDKLNQIERESKKKFEFKT